MFITSSLPNMDVNQRSYGSIQTTHEHRERSSVPEATHIDLETSSLLSSFESGSSFGLIMKSLECERSRKRFRYSGVIYAFLAANLFSLNGNLMQMFSHENPMTLTLYASPVGILVTIPFILYSMKWEEKPLTAYLLPWRDNKMNIFFVWLRAMASTLLFYGLLITYRYISVADARTVLGASVITINLFGWMCFRESCGFVPIMVAMVALCGIGVITRPPIITGAHGFDQATLMGVGLALICMVLMTIIALLLRHLSDVNHAVLNMSVCVWSFIFTLPFAIYMGDVVLPATSKELLGCMVIGLVEAVANTFFALALQNEEAGVVAFVRTSEVVFTFIWQWIIIGRIPDYLSYIGAGIVFFGVTVIFMRRRIATLDAQSPTKKRLKFLLC